MKTVKFKLKKKVIFKKKLNNFSLFKKNSVSSPSNKFNVQIANNLNTTIFGSSKKWSFDRWISLFIPAREANLLPPVGPFLGQHGFNTQNFCNSFNTLTEIYPTGLLLKTNIKLFSDKSIEFRLQTPPVSFLLYSITKLDKKISILDVFKIMLIKKLDLPNLNSLSLIYSILGTAWSMSFVLQ